MQKKNNSKIFLTETYLFQLRLNKRHTITIFAHQHLLTLKHFTILRSYILRTIHMGNFEKKLLLVVKKTDIFFRRAHFADHADYILGTLTNIISGLNMEKMRAHRLFFHFSGF